jgi:hypothetical protein
MTSQQVEGVPTPPTECALAISLPMTLASVQSALNGGAYSDYVGRGAARGNALALWQDAFRAVASTALSLSRQAAALGVMVIEDATLVDLGYIFSSRSVATIVAHWRGPQITRDDIIADPDTIAHRLAEEESDFACLFREGYLTSSFDRIRKSNSDSIKRSRLAESIDQRLSRYPALVRPPAGTEWSLDRPTLRHVNRSTLDNWAPQSFRPGNKLELSDGLHGAEAIAAAVPEGWSGVADLSNCQSAQLIQLIKRNRSDRIVIANEYDTNPIRRMALLSTVYGILSKGRTNYVDARNAIAIELSKPNWRRE